MTNPYRNINELREWLKANSSGAYRPAAHAATVIEEQESELITLRADNSEMRAKLAAIDSRVPVGKVTMAVSQDAGSFFNVEWYDHADFAAGDMIYAKPVPADKSSPSHWAIDNPGRADQYRCESLAVRDELGFPKESDEVSPRDLREAIQNLMKRKQATRITEQDAREIAQSALMFWRNTVNLTLDVWMKDHAPTLLNKLNADREQVPVVAMPDAFRGNLEQAHMCGQAFAGIDPSFSEAQQYASKALSGLAATPSHSQQSAITDSDRINYLAETRTLIQKMQEGEYFLVFRNGETSCGREDFRAIIDEHIVDRCPSHESEQSDSPALDDCCCGDTAESWRLFPAHSDPDSEGEK